MKSFKQLLETLPNRALSLDQDQGRVTLRLNDSHLINIEEVGTDICIYSPLINDLDFKPQQHFQLALEYNLFGKETGKGSIGYDSTINSLVYFQYISLLDFQKESLESALQLFLQKLTHLEQLFHPKSQDSIVNPSNKV